MQREGQMLSPHFSQLFGCNDVAQALSTNHLPETHSQVVDSESLISNFHGFRRAPVSGAENVWVCSAQQADPVYAGMLLSDHEAKAVPLGAPPLSVARVTRTSFVSPEKLKRHVHLSKVVVGTRSERRSYLSQGLWPAARRVGSGHAPRAARTRRIVGAAGA
jgi:hypothetical protein